jgi:hypothetical protein
MVKICFSYSLPLQPHPTTYLNAAILQFSYSRDVNHSVARQHLWNSLNTRDFLVETRRSKVVYSDKWCC